MIDPWNVQIISGRRALGEHTGRIAIVTGGAKGIGGAIVDRLASAGATIAILTSTSRRQRQRSLPWRRQARPPAGGASTYHLARRWRRRLPRPSPRSGRRTSWSTTRA